MFKFVLTFALILHVGPTLAARSIQEKNTIKTISYLHDLLKVEQQLLLDRYNTLSGTQLLAKIGNFKQSIATMKDRLKVTHELSSSSKEYFTSMDSYLRTLMNWAETWEESMDKKTSSSATEQVVQENTAQ